MTGRELITLFRELAADKVEPPLWSDALVLDCLNEAEREAADRARLIYDDGYEIAVTAGQARYAIDPHIIDIERAALTADGDARPPLRLAQYDRLELDRLGERRSFDRPFALVHDGDGTAEIIPAPKRNGLLLLEGYRLPLADFDLDGEPEIPEVHHRALVEWALFRAYSIPDADGANDQLAAFYHDRFEKYFGRRIDARKRRQQRANKPHVNKLW